MDLLELIAHMELIALMVLPETWSRREFENVVYARIASRALVKHALYRRLGG